MQSETQPIVILDGPARQIAGLAKAFSAQDRDKIPALWQAFFAGQYDFDHAVPGAMYGLSFDQDGAGHFRYGVGVEVTRAPAQMPQGTCMMQIEGGQYAVRRVFGPVTELPGQMDWLFCDWLPSSGYALGPGAVFERYPEDPRNTPGVMAYELWMPVRPAD